MAKLTMFQEKIMSHARENNVIFIHPKSSLECVQIVEKFFFSESFILTKFMNVVYGLKQTLTVIMGKLKPLAQRIQTGELFSNKGLCCLETKHLLLLSYCIQLTFYLVIKAEGRPVEYHPIVFRLAETRAYLEKIRSLKYQLLHQIRRLINRAEQYISMEAQNNQKEKRRIFNPAYMLQGKELRIWNPELKALCEKIHVSSEPRDLSKDIVTSYHKLKLEKVQNNYAKNLNVDTGGDIKDVSKGWYI